MGKIKGKRGKKRKKEEKQKKDKKKNKGSGSNQLQTSGCQACQGTEARKGDTSVWEQLCAPTQGCWGCWAVLEERMKNLGWECCWMGEPEGSEQRKWAQGLEAQQGDQEWWYNQMVKVRQLKSKGWGMALLDTTSLPAPGDLCPSPAVAQPQGWQRKQLLEREALATAVTFDFSFPETESCLPFRVLFWLLHKQCTALWLDLFHGRN